MDRKEKKDKKQLRYSEKVKKGKRLNNSRQRKEFVTKTTKGNRPNKNGKTVITHSYIRSTD